MVSECILDPLTILSMYQVH